MRRFRLAAFASALALLPGAAGADALVDNVTGMTIAKDGQVTRFTGLLLTPDGHVARLLAAKDKRPDKLDWRADPDALVSNLYLATIMNWDILFFLFNSTDLRRKLRAHVFNNISTRQFMSTDGLCSSGTWWASRLHFIVLFSS